MPKFYDAQDEIAHNPCLRPHTPGNWETNIRSCWTDCCVMLLAFGQVENFKLSDTLEVI